MINKMCLLYLRGKMVVRAVVRVKYYHNPQWLMAITLLSYYTRVCYVTVM